MSNWKNILIGTGISAGVFGIAKYLTGLNRISNELESVATVNVHSIKFDGLTIRIDVKLKNPTGTSLKIKFPFVKLLNNNRVVGTSRVIDKTIVIPKQGEVNINDIMVNIPASGLLSLGGGILKLLTKKQPVPITVQTITTIDLGWKKQAYSKTDDLTLNPKKA